MKHQSFLKQYAYFKQVAFIGILLIGSGYATSGWAHQSATVQNFATNITRTFSLLRHVLTVAAYAAGVGFSIIGLLKFKAHKDNPAQIPLSTPIALIAVSAGLLFLPTVFDIAGDAVFGSAARPGLTYQEFNLIN